MALVLVKFGKGEEIARTIFDISRENDDLVLFQDGVLWAFDEEAAKSLKDKKVNLYVLKEDLEARGYMQELSDGLTTVSYDKVIDLIAKNEQTIG